MAVDHKQYPGEKLMQKFPGGEIIVTKSEDLFNWAKGSSLFYMLGCPAALLK